MIRRHPLIRRNVTEYPLLLFVLSAHICLDVLLPHPLHSSDFFRSLFSPASPSAELRSVSDYPTIQDLREQFQSQDVAITALFEPFQTEVRLIGINKLLNSVAHMRMIEMAQPMQGRPLAF